MVFDITYHHGSGGLDIPILHQRDICSTNLKGSPGAGACVRSLLLKQQPLILGKVISQALLMPAGSLLCMEMRPIKPKDVALATVQTLELALIYSSTLIFTGLFLLMNIVSNRCLLHVALLVAKQGGEETPDFLHPDAAIASLGLTFMWSFAIHLGYASNDPLAILMIVAAMLRMQSTFESDKDDYPSHPAGPTIGGS